MSIQQDKLTEIANSIRSVKGNNDKIIANNFASEISSMAYVDNGNVIGPIATLNAQTIIPTTTNQVIQAGKYLKGNQTILGDANLIPANIKRGEGTALRIFNVRGICDEVENINSKLPPYCGKYAVEAVGVAKSYWITMANGTRSYTYSGGDSLYEGNLNDENGNGLIDCSTYINLILNGITYDNSPYAANKLPNATFTGTITPSTAYSWSDRYLNSQTNNKFRNGVIRYASDLAEYFFMQGRVFYDANELKPGDLTFHAGKDAQGNYHINNRFKNISHVGIVTEDTTKIYNVTEVENVVVRTVIANRSDTVFYARPDYTPVQSYEEFNANYNYLSPPYMDNSNTINGVNFNVGTDGSIVTSGSATASSTFIILSSSYPIHLPAGTYKLTGCPNRNDSASNSSYYYWGIRVLNVDGTDIPSQNGEFLEDRVWDRGYGAIFTLSTGIDIYANIYISSNIVTGEYTWTPCLKRIS